MVFDANLQIPCLLIKYTMYQEWLYASWVCPWSLQAPDLHFSQGWPRFRDKPRNSVDPRKISLPAITNVALINCTPVLFWTSQQWLSWFWIRSQVSKFQILGSQNRGYSYFLMSQTICRWCGVDMLMMMCGKVKMSSKSSLKALCQVKGAIPDFTIRSETSPKVTKSIQGPPVRSQLVQ